MNSLRISIRRTVSVAAAIALMFTTAIPALVAADQVTERSIELSSSTAAATGVSYNINFTAKQDAGAVVVDFCSNSPLLGSACTAPTGFSLSSATVGGGFTKNGASTASTLVATGTIDVSSDDTIVIPVSAVTNPTSTGALYARIITYTDGTGAAAYDDTTPGTHIDDGGVALSITDKIGVSAAVLETLTFCVAGAAITTAGCGGVLSPPTLTLGETTGSVKALSASAVSTGDIYTQISTNAAGGAVVNLKSSVACGGLQRFGASVCDIAPAGTTGFTTAPNAKFGVKVEPDTATDTSLSATGEFKVASGSAYDNTTYKLNWVSGNASGVGSVYGDPILDTLDAGNGDAPTQPSNRNMKLTFGASITNNTPAGLYKNDYSLIATGKF